MKYLIVLFIMAATQALPLPDEWESFKAAHNRTFDDPAEEMMRKEIFLKNKDRIEMHNKKYDEGQVLYRMGLNKFSDWTDAELKMLSGLMTPAKPANNPTATSA